MFDRGPMIAAGVIALIAFVVYALTAERQVPTGDSGELIAAAYVLGVAHPPGYPLYMLLGHLATFLPGGSPAFRINMLSALCDAITVGIVFVIVYRIVVRNAAAIANRWLPYVAAAVGALLLAFSTLFWAYSVVAEVFALNNLFAAALLLIALEWSWNPERKRLLWLFTFVFGLSLCNQQTIVFMLPAFVVLAWAGARRGLVARRLPVTVRDVGIAIGAFVAGLLPYLYLPIAGSTNPVMNWGDPTSFGRFKTDVTRGNYGSLSLGGTGRGSYSEQMRLLFGSLAHGFVVVGLVLALAGLWWAWKRSRDEGVALLVAFVVTGPIFQLIADTKYTDRLFEGIVGRFYILPSIPLAIVAGLGAWWALEHAAAFSFASLRPSAVAGTAAVALLVAPAAAAVAHYSGQDQSSNETAYDYGRDLLSPLPQNSILIMRSDENYTSVSYTQVVEHFRPDVITLDSELLKLASYVSQVRREHPSLLIPFTAYDGGAHTSLNALVRANLPERPVFFVGPQEEKKFGKPFDQEKYGLATRLVAKGTAPDAYQVMSADSAQFAALHYPGSLAPSSTWEGAAIDNDYAFAAFYLAYAIEIDGAGKQVPLDEQLFRKAIQLAPDLAAAYKDYGLVLHNENGDPKEIISVWTTFLRLDPKDPQAPDIRRALALLEQPAKK
jgi:tetratricopeptide (TPR) repeat protein